MNQSKSKVSLDQFKKHGLEIIRGQQEKESLVGVEMEFFAFCKESLAPLGTEGAKLHPDALLQKISDKVPESKLLVDSPTQKITGLKLPQGNITLEPGGQIEVASDSFKTLKEAHENIAATLKLIEEAAEGHVLFLSHGTSPLADASLPLVLRKSRYFTMTQYFESVPDGRGVHMMRYTGTVQPNIDVVGEQAWKEAVQLSFLLTPFVRNIFKNSAYFQNQASTFRSERQAIWDLTDGTRCGIPNGIWNADAPEENYLDWALHAKVSDINGLPLEEQPLHNANLIFEDWAKSGHNGKFPTIADWEQHLGTLFPEVRLRGFLEIRNVDAQRFDLSFAPVAWWMGVLRSESVRKEIFSTLEEATTEFYKEVFDEKVTEDKWQTRLMTLNHNAKIFSNINLQDTLYNLAIRGLQESGEEFGVRCLSYWKSHNDDHQKLIKQLSPEEYVREIGTEKPSELLERVLED